MRDDYARDPRSFAWRVPCPTCGAKPGQLCTSPYYPDLKRPTPHGERYSAVPAELFDLDRDDDREPCR